MKNLALSFLMIALLSGCDISLKIDSDEEPTISHEIVDVYCVPYPSIDEKKSVGYEIIINGTEATMLAVRYAFIEAQKGAFVDKWMPYWNKRYNRAVEPISGNGRFFLQELGKEVYMLRKATKEEELLGPNGFSWVLFQDPLGGADEFTHVCYNAGEWTKNEMDYPPKIRKQVDLKIRK